MEMPKFSDYTFLQGTWRLDTVNLKTPDGKNISVLLESENFDEPDEAQIGFLSQVLDRFPDLWAGMKKGFEDYLEEMDDEGKFEESYDWELSIPAHPEPAEEADWTVSFKLPRGHAAWYSQIYRAFELDVTHGTY